MSNDNKKRLYDALSSTYDLGTFEDFSKDIEDEGKRRKLYDATQQEYDFGAYEDFSSQLGYAPAPSAKEQLESFYAENRAFMDDFEQRDSLDVQDSAINAVANEGLSFFKTSRVSDEERQRYNQLSAQRKELEKAWYTSDEYLSQKNEGALELGQMRDDIHNAKKAYVNSQPQIKMSGLENAVMEGKTMGDYESQQFDIAARIMDKTIKLHNAPSKYDSNSGLKNMGIGAADKATDPALLSAGLTEITDNVGARVVLQKVQKELGNLNDLSEERIEKILSPAEKAVLRSWARYAQEQLDRQGDLSLGYQAGQGAVESLAFMAEFALTGGVGQAASEGAETLAKWLGKKWYGGFKGLGDEAAEAVMKAAGEKTLGKYGQKLGLALAETAGRTLVMPSTYRNISEKATEIETDEEGNSYLVGLNDAFIKGYADSFIENLSEGGRVNALGDLVGDVAGNIPAWKKMVNAFSNTKASEILKRLNSTGIMNTLRAGGWHGFGEEYLEEWYGNALRTITGVDKNALKDFATLDNQMVTLASFLPITIFGGTVSTSQVISAKRDLDKKAEALQSALMGRGYDEAQAKNMIDMMRAETPQGISNLITPLIRRVAGANENEARELAKPAMEFAWAVRRYQSYDTKYSYQQQEQRDNLKAEMETKLGKFWMEDENGQQTVQRGVNEKGEVVYLLGKKDIEEAADGIGAEKEVAAIDAEGNHIFVFPSDYRLEEELPMNDFLGIEIMTQKRDSEAVRMASERDAKLAEVKSRSRLGTQLNIGTNEAPVIATISKVDADGVVVETPEGFRKITYTELANKYADINPAVYTDAELDEQEADNISAERAQREAALDQEYENDDDAIEELAEAENEIEQSVEEATKLPLKDDGTVDQAALWNDSPARWAKWNDEQKQDGGADTLAYLNTAIKAQTAKIEQLVAAQDAETDFDRRDAIAAELSEARMRQGDLLALHGQYTAQVEAQAIQQQAAQPVQPAPQLTEEEKAALEEERRKPLRAKAKELSEKLGVKVKLAEDLSDVKESIAREQLLKSVVSNGKQKVAGWYNQATGEVTIFLPHAESVEDVEKTFIHEVVAHKGLRGLLGEEGFNVLCDAVWDMMSEGEKIRFINYPGVNGDKRAAADEYMAHFAETLNLEEAKPDMWERIVAIIKQILDSMGVRLRINQEGLSSVIAASYQKLLADAKAAQGVSAEAVTETATETIAEEPQTGGTEVISEEQLNAPNSGEAQQIIASDGEVLADTDGKGGVRFSIRTWEEGGRDYLAAWLANDQVLARLEEIAKEPKMSDKQRAKKMAELADERMAKIKEQSRVIDLVEEAKKAVAREDAKGNVSFRITPEMKEIKEKTQADGTFMKAPNGQPTNLSEEQWLMVRTENFKKWFGDWENDPENASKVVDENGEPKVVFHQTNQNIYVNRETGENWDELGWKEKMEWDERDDWEDYWEEQDFNTFSRVNARTTNEFDGFFFAPEYDEYHEYGDRTIAAFVDIKNPASREDYNIDSRYNDAGRNERIRLQEAGFDGVIRMDGDNVDEYIAFEPNQIKSATDNNGDFNPNNNDIRFRITPEQDKAYMDAVEAGDMETAQRMVIEAAKLAMPNTKVVDKKGNPTVVYHGTKGKFNTFAYSREDIGFHFGTKSTARTRIGRGKDARIMHVFLNLENPLIFDTDLGSWDADYIVKDLLKKEMMSYDDAKAILFTPNGYKRNSVSALVDLRQWMSNNGYDGIVYPNWYESNGKDSYIALSRPQIKSADPVTYDDAGNVIPLSERFNPEKSDIRFRFTPRTEEQREKLFADAKEKFGVTNNFKVAGYMLPDGSLLDFSEANDGGDPNVRSLDHRSIEDVIMEDGTEYDSRWMYLADFMNEGAIRLLPEYAGINLMKAPTKEQRQRLMDFIYKYNGEVILEIADERLNNAAYVEYDRRTSPSRIFRDIDGYFNEGIVPQQDIRFRVANENQTIFVSNAAKAVEGIKMEKATPEQWLKMIEKNGGLKAGEDKWMGLSDFLKASDKKTLTKQEVLDFVNEHMIQIEEQHYGINAEDDAERAHGEITEKLQDRFDHYEDEYYQDHDWEDGETDNAREYAIERLREEMGDTFPYTIELEYGSVYLTFPYEEEDDLVKWAEKTGVKYTSGVSPINDIRLNYTTDGLGNKHEIALTVPTIESWNKGDETHFGDAGDGRAVAWIRFGETEAETSTEESKEAWKEVQDYIAKMREKYGPHSEAWTLAENKQYSDLLKKVSESKQKNKVLVIDEIQSKRHQEGRERGYRPGEDTPVVRELNKLIEEQNDARSKYYAKIREIKAQEGVTTWGMTDEKRWEQADEEFAKIRKDYHSASSALSKYQGEHQKELYSGEIPDAPFDKNWHELAMKRMLRYAAENGYDYIAWTKGDQQAERYNIGGVISEIKATKYPRGYEVVSFGKNGRVVHNEVFADENAMAEVYGKGMSQRIIESIDALEPSETATISGDNLRVGGEGMKGFYDRMLPAFMNKYGKKWGVKVSDIELTNVEKSGRIMHSVPITEEMKASVMEGQVMFRMREEGESAMDFHQSALDDFGTEFNIPAPTTMVDVNDRDAVAVALGYTPEEFTDEQYQYILEGYEMGGSGIFDPETKKIAIFVKESKQKTSQVYNDIFHENTHYLVDKHPELLELGEWLWNNPEPKLRRMVKEKILAAGKMYEGEEFNEMLSGYTGLIMSLGKADVAFEKTPSELKKHWELIFNAFGYGPERNDKIRRRGAGDNTGGVGSIRYRSNVGEQKHNNASQEALTAEERRIIGEYFPEFNKSEDVRMRVNSQGKELTEGQREFFANSKAVDKDGNLLVLYHGTPRAGFTEFNSGWFTTSKEDAISYSGDRKGRLFDPNEEYVPETLTAGDYRLGYMTFDSEEDRAEFLERFPYADEVMSERDYENARMEAEDEEYDALTNRIKEFREVWNAYREYERDRFVDTKIGDLISNPEVYTEEDLMRAMMEYDSNTSFDYVDDLSEEERKDVLVAALQNANEETEGGIFDIKIPTRVPRNGEGLKHNDLRNRTYEAYINIERPYEIDANGRGTEWESGDVYKAIRETLANPEYDGVIVRNWRTGRYQQLGDVVVPKNGSQIKLTSNENPTESSDIRFRTSLELDEEFGDAWRNQQNEDGRHSTQVANTKSTYEKIGHYLEDAGMKGASILDASSGLGLGTQALREMGFQVDDVEPFPSENREAPTFSSYADIDGKYDVVISNAVLNVIPDDWRADVLHQMADAVKEGGKMIINTRPASNIAQQGVEGKTRITLDSPSEILVKRGDRIAAYQKGFTSEELAEWIKSELGEGWRVEKATKKNSGISGEGTAVVIKDGDNVSFRTTGTPTDEVVANGVDLTPSQTSEVAANIFAALPKESRKKITEGLNGNILGLKDAILQIPASLASKENWNDEDRVMADIVAEEMTKMAGEMTRPFSAPEALWLLYNNLNKSTDLVSLAQRSLVQRNLGFDAQTLATENEAKEFLRFRQVGDARINATASLYNKGAVNVMTRLKESFVDMNASVEELVKAIEERTGKKAEGFENILWALNQQSSRGLAAMEDYERRFLNPMYDAIRNIMDKGGFKYEDVVRYVILKHGLERNKKLAQRDAKAHYQEIYDEIIEKINSMDDRQKRTYLTNAQLKEADAKAKLAALQAKDTSTLTEDEMKDHKKELAVARKEVKEAEEYRERAEKIRNMSEQEAKDELDKIFEKIENGTDSIYKELRESDYSGLTSMFYDQLGVDRNLFATEEAYQSALMNAKEDKYSSLEEVEAAAEAEVKKFEGAVDTKELWKRVNAATKETLRQQYEANMISKDQYLNLRDMFEYYVPLRGFKDNTAEDMYTYYRKPNSTGYTKPILGAEGRKTEAESPFGWIASMAGSAIASNVKNEAKLALFYFVSNRQNNGVATISKTWYVHTPGDVDERGKKIFKPVYPPFSEDLSSDAAKAQYEQWQDDMRKLKEQGLAYEAGQRLNLGNAVVNISDANKPEHIVAVKVGGKEYTIVINGNPRAAQAINGELNLEGTADDYSALFGPVLRWMSSVNTSYNPEFWITNMMRDMAFTWMAVNTKGADDKEYRRKFSKNYRKAFKVISLVAKNEKGTLGNSPIEQAYKDFVENGGVTGYTQIKDNETWEKEIEEYLKSNDPESLKSGKMMRGMKTVFHAAHRFGESLEQVSRFAAFLTAQEMGKSINEAVNEAKEITVNFNRKGSGKMISLEEAKHLTDKNGRPLSKAKQWMVVGLSSIAPLGRRFIMFFNAAIQGLNATYKLWKANPKRFKGWVMGYFAVGAMNAILHAMMDDDDDYLDMPQYERRNALMIGGNGAYLKWALPQEARAFYALGDIVVESMLGRNPQKFWQKGGEVGQILTTVGEVLPINPTEGWRAVAPSIAIPALELMINEDYKGEAIYNESKWLSKEEASRTAKWNTAKSGTGWTHVKIAQGLNFLTGGDKYDAGLINIRPEAIEHLVQSAFGGTIRTADKFVNTITSIIDPEEEWTVKQTPFLNRVLTLNDERYRNVHVNEVFDYYAAEAEHTKTLEKKYRKDGDSDALLDLTSSDEYQWMMIYENYKKPLENVRERLKVAEGTRERKQIMREQDELKKMMIKQISNL